MPEDPSSVIQAELGPNEELLWSGQPRQGIVFRVIDIYLIPFSLMWGGGVLVFETMALSSNGLVCMALIGIPFVLIGLYFIFGRFIVDAKQREKTYYGVTTERCIIISGLFNRHIESINLRTLGDLSLQQKRDGSGTITFGPAYPFTWLDGVWPNMGQQMPATFQMIPDAKKSTKSSGLHNGKQSSLQAQE